MKLKSECCEKYKEEAKACKRCPLLAPLPRKERKRFLEKWKKRRRRR